MTGPELHCRAAVPTARELPPRRTKITLSPASVDRDDAPLAAAFRDLHGPRLHGFALLVTLGETHDAERAAGDALAAGAEQADALRHPERAAAWLRARVLHGLRQSSRDTSILDAVRREALAALGAGEEVFQGLAPLRLEARAALVASAIERFEPIDIETILGAAPAAARRRIAEARRQYLQALGTPSEGEPGTLPDQEGGKLAANVLGIASRTMAVDEAPE